MTIEWKPCNMPTLTPALPGGGKRIEFVTAVFGAKIEHLYPAPGGGVAHAEIRLGESLLMTGDPMGEHVLPAGALQIYVPDVDAAFQRALAAGASAKEEPKDQFWGDRSARVIDPFGNQWSISTHVEDVSAEEINRRMEALMGG